MSKCVLCFVACLLLVVVHGVNGQQPSSASGAEIHGRLPRDMSDEERIAARAATGSGAFSNTPQSASGGFREVIDGKETPELLLPYELFDDLLEGLSNNEQHRTNARRFLDPRLPEFGLHPATFWSTLRMIVGPYLNAREESSRLHRQATVFTTPAGTRTFVPINRADCALRVIALNDARQKFGRAELDHFLYEVVAPHVSHSVSGGAPDRAAQLRYMARGCK